MPSSLWDIDVAHSAVQFWVRHMLVTKVRGCFARWSGVITLDELDVTRSSVSVRIDAASIAPRWAAPLEEVAERNARLQSAAFLDVANYPEITFRSKLIQRDDSGYRLVGDLSLHGVEREVTLEAQFGGITRTPGADERARFSARTAFNRRDYGLVWDSALETGSIVVGANVGVAIELEAVRTATSPSVAA